MINQKVMCDKCHKGFKIKKLKKKAYTDGKRGKVFFHYFVCPHCLEKYVWHVESDEINRLIKERKRLYQSTATILDEKEAEKAFKEVDRIEKQIKKM
ncbi:hypothetical protein PZE06_20850 [Robertmurraya sp. DFI.2.37]|uniref:hypothetical protein n=1 Tax=Robertmurraya sp. DFI.2.37 TaxID=3031819 RepID=UPI0012461377|nr:hypothetical protein [Robertmurraya sp. DFI.2.37]MDF1510586.1 hypothetical protein [Robertmurraya sp. DFI.2.37]